MQAVQNHNDSSNLNVPNVLTFVRLLCALALPFLWRSGIWGLLIFGGIVFTIGSITDYADGQYARRYNVITNLGKVFDPIADKLLTLGAFFVLATLDVMPMWVISLIAFREIGVTLLRFYFLRHGKAIAAVKSGKQKTTFQIITIYVGYVKLLAMQFDSLPAFVLSGLNGLLFIFLALSLWQTMYSGYDFVRLNWESLRPKKKQVRRKSRK
jgi:CDP-diacylglycerol--glycerol-3-phosphate 3-phosphatidyltransferase